MKFLTGTFSPHQRLQKDQLAQLSTSTSQFPDLPVQSTPPSAPEVAAVASSLQTEAAPSPDNANPELESLKQMMDSLTEKLKSAEQIVEQSNSGINQKSG